MIRWIYAELPQTAYYRDRMDIKQHAMQGARRKAFIEVASWIPDMNVKTDSLDPNLGSSMWRTVR
jgi:hypothetical protein